MFATLSLFSSILGVVALSSLFSFSITSSITLLPYCIVTRRLAMTNKEITKKANELLKKSGFYKKDSRSTVNGRKRRLSRKKQKNT